MAKTKKTSKASKVSKKLGKPAKRKRTVAKQAARRSPVKREAHLRKSKTEGFLEKIRNNSMVEYFTRLRILNPAAQLMSKQNENEPRREGGFVRLAHAREEFTAPVLTKGKSVVAAQSDLKKKRK
jgi:hypothetical protein